MGFNNYENVKMAIDFLLDRFKAHENQPAIIWNESTLTYHDLLERFWSANEYLRECGIQKGEIVALNGDFTPNAIALLLALIENRNIIVPFNFPLKEKEHVKYEIAEVQKEISVNVDDDRFEFRDHGRSVNHDYYQSLREGQFPGLVLFSSGTSGFPKGAVHNFSKLLEKFRTVRKSLRTVNFLLFDHWGGLNTLFHTLSNCGVVLALRDRRPEAVCKFIEEHKIELLPVSPSFLNLLLLSESYKNRDMSSLKLISYGTEPMPIHTLKRAKKVFPDVRFQQTYGLIELGVLRSKSKSDDSLWVKLGGEGFDLRVVDNLLQIKADSAMMGYLNAPSPFTDDGYFMTGDEVEVDGEYFKILGRKSEIINVGGDKVYPQEVENVIMDMDNVKEVIVYGEKHIMMGNIVCAKVSLKKEEEKKEFVKKLKTYCKERLQPFKVPVKIFVEEGPFYSDRFKKVRTNV